MNEYQKLEKTYDWYDHRIQWFWGFLAGWLAAMFVALLVIVVTCP